MCQLLAGFQHAIAKTSYSVKSLCMPTLANQASPLAKLLYTRQNEEFANFGNFCDNHSKLNKLNFVTKEYVLYS